MMHLWFALARPLTGRTGLARELTLAVVFLWLVQPALGGISGIGQPHGILLRLDGIKGESTLPKHEGWIPIEALEWHLAGGEATGAGAGGLGVVPAPVSFLKRVDKSSPLIAEAVCQGKVIPQAGFEFYALSDGGKLARFYQVQLENVQVGAFSLEGGSGSERPREQVTLDFQRAEWTYTEFSTDGLPLADYRAFWDFVLNKGGYERIRLGFKVSGETEIGRNGIRLRWLAEAGRTYRILRSDLVNGQFTQALPDVASTGDGEQEIWVPREGPFAFFIVVEVEEGGTP